MAGGYGRSINMIDSISYELLTDDMEQLIGSLKLDHVNVCGFSDGGIVALYMAAKYPKSVGKVFVSGANYMVIGPTSSKANETIDIQKINNSPFWRSIKEKFVKLNPHPETFERHVQLINRMWNHNPCIPRKDFVKINVPVFLMFGDRDIIPLEHGLEMYRLLPGKTTQLCILPNTSHFTFSEKPDFVNDLLISFLYRNK